MADVQIEGSVSTATARGLRSVAFTTALIGYWFCIDSDGTFGYRKTTDGGATWGAAVVISAATTNLAYDVWFDKWTPGDVGTKIHTWYFDTTVSDVLYRSLDTAADTLGTQRVVFAGASALAGRGIFVSGTKTLSGFLYCGYDIDAGTEKGFHRSTDAGVTWSASLAATFIEATIDQCLLFPASNTGDGNDCWALYQDASADALTLKMWDSSAVAATESATIQTMIENVTDLTGQMGFSASVRHSDGHLIVATVSERDTVTADHQVFDINGTGSITALAAINANVDDHYYPSVFINQVNNNIFVFFNGASDGSETLGTATKVYYNQSTDAGASWLPGDFAYTEGITSAIFQVWAPLMGPRLYAGWRVGTTLIGNKVNSLTFAAATTLAAATGAFAETGNAAVLRRGLCLPSVFGAFAHTGKAANLCRGLKVPAITGVFSETGNAAALVTAKKILAVVGVFVEAGPAVKLVWAHKLAAALGVFSEVNPVIALVVGKRFAAQTGIFLETGNAATFPYQRVLKAQTGVFAETGNPVILAWAHKMPSAFGVFVLTGNPAVLRGGKNMVVAFGAFADTHRAASLLWAHRLTSATGVFTLVAPLATLRQLHRLLAASGVFSEVGNPAILSRGLKLSAVKGVFAETGNPARLAWDRKLVSALGVFLFTGNNANLVYGSLAKILNAQTGLFVHTGNPAALRPARNLPAALGVFTETGNPAALRAARRLLASQGLFSETGNPATLRVGRRITASRGIFIESGIDARLIHRFMMRSAVGEFLFAGTDANLVHGFAYKYFGIPQVGSEFDVVIDRPFQEFSFERFFNSPDEINE